MIAAFCSLAMLSVAPQAWITGVVSDAMGPVIGATVAVKGTSNGTSTDNDGQFSLNVSPGQTLVVTYVGYLTKEVKVGQQNYYDILIEEDQQLLDEVVVVGYGTMKKSDISGSSVSLGEKAVKGSIITSLDQSLQGRAAGTSLRHRRCDCSRRWFVGCRLRSGRRSG